MSADLVSYRNWKFEAVKLQNVELYKRVNLSGTESCDCSQCQEFISIRKFIYPQEIKDLFIKLGVDINKEYELCDYGNKENGHLYNWWFHFVGELIEGEDCIVPFDKGGSSINLLKINEFFKVGFTKTISSSFFENNNLVEIVCWAELPWDTSNLSKILKINN